MGDIVNFQGYGWESVCSVEPVRWGELSDVGAEAFSGGPQSVGKQTPDRARNRKKIRSSLFALRPAAIVDVEFEAWVWREDLGNFSQTLCHWSRGQQRIISLAQIVIVDVEVKREQVD